MPLQNVLLAGPPASWIVDVTGVLETLGAQVTFADDGADVLDALAERHYDLVIISADESGLPASYALASVRTCGMTTPFLLVHNAAGKRAAVSAAALHGARHASTATVVAELRAWISVGAWSRHVIIAEDDAELRALLVEELTRRGLEVTPACDGVELVAAVERAAAGGIGVDAVVTDVRMPCLDGLEALERIRRVTTTLPVIFMSGFADIASSRCAALGAAALLAKPVDIDDLMRCISDVVACRRAPSASNCAL